MDNTSEAHKREATLEDHSDLLRKIRTKPAARRSTYSPTNAEPRDVALAFEQEFNVDAIESVGVLELGPMTAILHDNELSARDHGGKILADVNLGCWIVGGPEHHGRRSARAPFLRRHGRFFTRLDGVEAENTIDAK